MCHSDISVIDGILAGPLPMVLGHEGAGTVAAVGEGVPTDRIGERVVLSWLAQCGHCYYCSRNQPALCEVAQAGLARSGLPDGTTRYSRDGDPVYHMLGLGTFSAVQGARIGGARQVIAIDPSEERLDLAGRLGATDVLRPEGNVAGQCGR